MKNPPNPLRQFFPTEIVTILPDVGLSVGNWDDVSWAAVKFVAICGSCGAVLQPGGRCPTNARHHKPRFRTEQLEGPPPWAGRQIE